MAFAVAVIQGQKQLADCPYIDRETLHSLGGNVAKRSSREEEEQEMLSRLRQDAAKIDFFVGSGKTGGTIAEWQAGDQLSRQGFLDRLSRRDVVRMS